MTYLRLRVLSVTVFFSCTLILLLYVRTEDAQGIETKATKNASNTKNSGPDEFAAKNATRTRTMEGSCMMGELHLKRSSFMATTIMHIILLRKNLNPCGHVRRDKWIGLEFVLRTIFSKLELS